MLASFASFGDVVQGVKCRRKLFSVFLDKCLDVNIKRLYNYHQVEGLARDAKKRKTMQTAQNILNQIGGNRFIAMTGAKNFLGGDSYLQFSIGRGAANKANRVKITLEASDTYTVEFFNYRKFEAKPVGLVENVYADQLQAIFTSETGFDTHL